jgi:hypothetical protein
MTKRSTPIGVALVAIFTLLLPTSVQAGLKRETNNAKKILTAIANLSEKKVEGRIIQKVEEDEKVIGSETIIIWKNVKYVIRVRTDRPDGLVDAAMICFWSVPEEKGDVISIIGDTLIDGIHDICTAGFHSEEDLKTDAGQAAIEMQPLGQQKYEKALSDFQEYLKSVEEKSPS